MKRWLIALVVLSACHKNGPQDITHPITLPSSGSEVVAAENQFSLNLFQAVNAQDTVLKNKIVSPFSVYMALGMADNGAGSTTLNAINKTLGLGALSTADLNGTASALIQQLPAADSRVTLSVANSEWYNQQFTPSTSFSQTLQTAYNAKVEGLDFSSPSSVSTINQWVSDQTQQMIPNILDRIDPSEIMFLVNAIYFKGTWTTAFDAGLTQPAAFTRGDGVIESVPTMITPAAIPVRILWNDTASLVELPYGGGHFVMDILVPGAGQNIRSLSAGLTPAILANWISRLSGDDATVKLPKFKFSYGAKLDTALIRMGMGIAYSDIADFSGMFPATHVQISRVLHQAVIDVDESGTKAAASTVVGMRTGAVGPGTIININQAFLFTIRETTSGVVLFTGLLNDPLSAGN